MSPSKALSPTPQGTEGPFYLPKQPLRSDIREDRTGLPMSITFNLKRATDGSPIPNGEVHVWHADADGIYSGYLSLYPLEKNPVGGMGHVEATDDLTFLRGIQPTSELGSAKFQTIFPGFYGVRSPHIHFMVFVGGKSCLTGEVYFQDKLTDDIINAGVKPYCDRDTTNKITNARDPLFETYHGEKTVVIPEGDFTKSLTAALDIILDL